MSARSEPENKGPKFGPFLEGAADWHQHGIPVFPAPADQKKAGVSNYLKMGLKASRELAQRGRFVGFNLGIVGGPKSGITVIDYDTTDESVVQECERHRFGPTPVKVRSPSGHFHGYYRFTDEGRHVRIFGKGADAPPVDCLGHNSFIVAPHSVRDGKPYEFAEGRLEDLTRVPTLRPGWRDGLAFFADKPVMTKRCDDIPSPHGVAEGSRNNALFNALREMGQGCPTYELLLQYARGVNATYDPPDDDSNVVRTVNSVWKMKREGRLFSTGIGGCVIPHAALDAFRANTSSRGNSDACLLYSILLRNHRNRDEPFCIAADAMARDMSMGTWNPKQIVRAKEELLKLGLIEIVHRGGRCRGDPSTYRFRDKGPSLGVNVTNTLSPSSSLCDSGRGNFPKSAVKRMARAASRAAQGVKRLSEHHAETQ